MRWIMRLVGLIVVLAVVAAGLLLLLPSEKIARIATDQISALTGRDVLLEGETKISFYPVLGVSTGKLTIANADWSDGGPMFEAEQIKIGVQAKSLMGGDIRITGIEATRPRIRLERAADGKVNWELGVEGVAPSGQVGTGGELAESSALALTLDRALIRDASVSYTDHETGETTELKDIDLDLRWPDYEGTATFDASLRPADETVSITGQLEKVGHFLDGGISGVTADVKTNGGTITFDGRAGVQPQIEGALTGSLTDTATFLASLGVEGVDVPQGMGRSMDVSMNITMTPEMQLSVRDMVLQLDGNRLTGAADVSMQGDKPNVNLQLNAGVLDLSALTAESGGGDSAAPADGWSKAPIDASALALMNAEVALVADSVNLGDFKLGAMRTKAVLDQSRLVFELREMRGYDGNITGQFVVNNRSGLSVGGNLNMASINLETFLDDAVGISRFAAKSDGKINFVGSGASQHAIMNSLNGDGSFRTGRGIISGFDLDKLMRGGGATGGTTVFDEMSATFNISKGNVFNEDLFMSLPLAKSRGEGRIGLGGRDIDYVLTPSLLEGDGGSGLAIPVNIRGPWANPRIVPDLEKALKLNFKGKAEDEVNKVLENSLGIEVEEGQSTEDAVAKKAKKKAKKVLKGLFD